MREPTPGASPVPFPDFDVFIAGTVTLDLVFTDVPSPVRPGTEAIAGGMTLSPGGMANVAVALARLGVNQTLASALSGGLHGQWLRSYLTEAGVDLRFAREYEGWQQPTTVSLAAHGDRAMVTHLEAGGDFTLDQPLPSARIYFEYISHDEQSGLVSGPRPQDSLFVRDCGWDADERWSPAVLTDLDGADVFLPNAKEAMAFTRASSLLEAAKQLAECVPLVIIKCGARGAIALDSASGSLVSVPGLPTNPVDATGAGDIFAAGFIAGCLEGLDLVERVAFANLCAAISVTRPGGATASPTWTDIRAALAGLDPTTADRYEFVAGMALEARRSNNSREVPSV